MRIKRNNFEFHLVSRHYNVIYIVLKLGTNHNFHTSLSLSHSLHIFLSFFMIQSLSLPLFLYKYPLSFSSLTTHTLSLFIYHSFFTTKIKNVVKLTFECGQDSCLFYQVSIFGMNYRFTTLIFRTKTPCPYPLVT